ncbi:hypothetical protein [Chitinophaga nivalis]|uniref:DUF4270 domain-containing protein n=1 Tax=Chitinophaga nivalis TaxID=2991709 RepID=A0ABT3IJ04_9BACT|nr:hypothetical protein [Chitinophaga nivalis]MCW3466382.1 hypothetical protein [Chitinophaga nivalis]MCW3483927.1 hypothetical protein [Chitinophaga nivalis]
MKQQQLLWAFSILLLMAGCRKTEYTKIDAPAYLRVFNDLNYVQSMDTKDSKYPSLCMIINPEIDAAGLPVGGEIVGDFLDKRDPYAPPYPSHIGNSSSVHNPEYPGKETVLVGPILNGFDLSSWAQVPSGKIRIMFYYRSYNTIPFFQLEEKLKRDVLLDTTIDLTAGEVYTLHVLEKDFNTKARGMLLRQENFHKLSLSDSTTYINFYNYSASGFVEADAHLKPLRASLKSFLSGIKDSMNIYLTLLKTQTNPGQSPALTGFKNVYLGQLVRDLGNARPATYYSFPLWADVATDHIRTDMWQRFELVTPGIDAADNPYNGSVAGRQLTFGNFSAINCLLNGKVDIGGVTYLANGLILPNLLVNVHSGTYNPRTFATVNTIEIVNSSVYLTTIQRKYPAPVY